MLLFAFMTMISETESVSRLLLPVDERELFEYDYNENLKF